jgi:hypothetical protein
MARTMQRDYFEPLSEALRLREVDWLDITRAET